MLDYKLIGSRIQQKRVGNGLTQEKVSEEIGITSVYLSKIENGHARPRLDLYFSICECIGCDLVDILCNTSTREKEYQSEKVVDLFSKCAPEIKPIALDILEKLSEIAIK